MKRFTLYTAKHAELLRGFAKKNAAAKIIYIHKNGVTLDIETANHCAFCETLLNFLMDIAEGENPIYKNSSKMRKAAKDLRSAPVFANESRLLSEFVASETELNIEGYITFRMHEFHEKLDTMVYSLVKKIKFGTED